MSTSKYWKVGEIALARVSKKVYAKVQVVKNEDGIFHDEKVLGITGDENGVIVTTQLCYHVEIVRFKQQMWLPYTSLQLAERSRPYYGSEKSVSKADVKTALTKRKIEEILPINENPSILREPDLNISIEKKHEALKQAKNENDFQQFVRLGREHLFDHFYKLCLETGKNSDILDYLENVDGSTEDNFEMVIKNIITVKEIDNYFHQCWKYTFDQDPYNPEEIDNNLEELSEDDTETPSMIEDINSDPINVHAPWCLVCGGLENLWECTKCPASFHLECRKEWLVNITHRKSSHKTSQKQVTLVAKILSSTRTIESIEEEKENLEMCPSCMWGPKVGYGDVVWHKLSTCSWWPARVLAPGAIPQCLLARTHAPEQWPLQYYGTLQHSWGDGSRMCLFLPKHTISLQANDEMLHKGMWDACDDYIAVYLT